MAEDVTKAIRELEDAADQLRMARGRAIDIIANTIRSHKLPDGIRGIIHRGLWKMSTSKMIELLNQIRE